MDCSFVPTSNTCTWSRRHPPPPTKTIIFPLSPIPNGFPHIIDGYVVRDKWTAHPPVRPYLIPSSHHPLGPTKRIFQSISLLCRWPTIKFKLAILCVCLYCVYYLNNNIIYQSLSVCLSQHLSLSLSLSTGLSFVCIDWSIELLAYCLGCCF